MQIYLDNLAMDSDARTLGQAVAAARQALADTGRLIVEVRIDGQVIGADDLGERHDEALAGDELQLITADPADLARQTLMDVSDALAANAEPQQRAAELLRDDQPDAALAQVRDALAVWAQAQQSVLDSARLLQIDLDALTVDDQRVAQIVEGLAEHLRRIREQLLAADWLGLADTLAYELDDSIGTWQRLIDRLAEQIDQR